MKRYKVYSNPVEFNEQMLEDIENAKISIYLETYIYDKGKIGGRYKSALIKKAKEGVQVKLLFDSFGSSAKKSYFKDLIQAGGEVRVFREMAFAAEIITNHERDHRKLLLIDHKISYVGSANISDEHMHWRECVLRVEDKITVQLELFFLQNWESHNKHIKKRVKSALHRYYEVVDDFPSALHSPTKKKYLRLINLAKKEINIESAYFIPPKKIRTAIYRAIRRGVNVRIVIPDISDVWLVDYVRNLYLEKLYRRGVKLFYYKKELLHSKIMTVDNDFFMIGSTNITFRAFVYNYEINLAGNNKGVVKELKKHFKDSLNGSEPFVYEKWKKRSFFRKLAEKILSITKRWT